MLGKQPRVCSTCSNGAGRRAVACTYLAMQHNRVSSVSAFDRFCAKVYGGANNGGWRQCWYWRQSWCERQFPVLTAYGIVGRIQRQGLLWLA